VEEKIESDNSLGDRTFWAQRLDTNVFYQIQADLLWEGEFCKIWMERNAKGSVNSATARSIADEYDNIIYPRMIDAFSVGGVTDGSVIIANNTMEYADWLTDGDGKLSILLLDIQDGYTPDAGSYVGGYFWYGNFLKVQYSNETDMIYVDTYPGKPGEAGSNKTLAHEMQHLMNFATSFLTRYKANTNTLYLMDVWIDEGLSSAAEYIYLREHVPDRYGWFNSDRKGTIAKGNNFFVWGNYNDDSILDDYATVYLFFQWLRLQSGGTGIYKSIISSQSYNYLAVTEAMGYKEDWGTLLKTWLAANYINASSGPYGYKGEDSLSTVQAKTAPAGTTSLQLLPGEGVYSMFKNGVSVSGSGNIKYAGLYKKDPEGLVNDTISFGGALLTFNANTDLEGVAETGQLTGVAADVSAAQSGSAGARSVGNTAREGPVSIDARDMLARNGRSGEGFDRLLPLGAGVLAGETPGE
jgi:hypothetical protein